MGNTSTSECHKDAPIFDACKEMIPQNVFKFNRVQVNVDFGTKRHLDQNNWGESLFGRMGGAGALALETGERLEKDKWWYKFKGQCIEHWTEPFVPAPNTGAEARLAAAHAGKAGEENVAMDM